jgi:broad specificity phosphatase PhoE
MAARTGISWPDPVRREELDEHQGIAVVKQLTGHGSPDDDAIHEPISGPQHAEELKRLYFSRYREIITRWASGEVSVQGLESWSEFRARTARGLEQLTMTDTGVESSAAFTSGGFIAAAVGHILGLDDHRIVELSLVIQNCSVTEIRYSGNRRTLVALNQVPDAIGLGLASFV